MSVHVSVESLVLVGVAPRHGARVAEAFTAELSRLLVERPLALRESGAVGVVDGGEARMTGPAGRRPEALGRAAARAVHAGLPGGEARA